MAAAGEPRGRRRRQAWLLRAQGSARWMIAAVPVLACTCVLLSAWEEEGGGGVACPTSTGTDLHRSERDSHFVLQCRYAGYGYSIHKQINNRNYTIPETGRHVCPCERCRITISTDSAANLLLDSSSPHLDHTSDAQSAPRNYYRYCSIPGMAVPVARLL